MPLRTALTLLTAALFATTALAADPDAATQGQRGPGVPEFAVRTGYKVTLAVERFQNARFLEFDDNGILYVSNPGIRTAPPSITSFRAEPDGAFEQIAPVVTGKSTVHGMHFHKGHLWFTTSGAIFKAKTRADGSGLDDLTTVVPEGQLPSGGGHWWRPILVDDTGFYTAVGDPGNITDVDASDDPLTRDREKIWRFNLDGSGKTLFASGLRNTEKLRFRPGTTEVWGCDHGSDNFGERLGERAGRNQPFTNELPGEELNHYQQGKFYGHPFIVDNNVPRIEFHNRKDILDLAANATPPAWRSGAHWANNGFTFLSKETFPNHKGDMLVAFHGSWNDTVKSGYCIQRILFDPLTGKPMGSQILVSCLSPTGAVLGRPVDCVEAPDGTILFSVDAPQGRVYRLSPADK